MITDKIALETLKQEWLTANQILDNVIYDYNWVLMFGVQLHQDYGDLATSLCLVFALSILEHVLIQMRDEGCFSCSSSQLYRLMIDSKKQGVPWVDFDLMNEIREKRNIIAHRNARLSESENRELIKAIGEQLSAWEIIN